MFGGPGTGKSTVALGVAHVLKGRYQTNSEYVSEYAKELAWENNKFLISDQLHVTANQNRGLERLRGNVDFAVCDSPLILGIHYSTNYFLKSYENMVIELFHSYDNINFFIERVKPYNPKGRFQSEEEAIHIDGEILKLLGKKRIPYISIRGDEFAVDNIIKHLHHPLITK